MISGNAALPGSYDYAEVARSVLIAMAASYVALDLAGRVTAARGRGRLPWLCGGAIAMGIGIWAMHFKGMLAYHLPVPVEYDWPTMLASLLLAIVASALALYVASRQKMSWVQALTGGVVMAVGIAGMHYVGMAAMRLPAITHYSPLLVISSVLLAILFSLLGLLMAFDLREETKWSVPRRLGSAFVMGVAVSGMHYTGMAAATFIPASLPDLSHAVSISVVGNNAIAFVTLIVLLAAMATSSVDRRADAEIRRLNEDLGRRVFERTLQLEAANQDLKKEIVVRERAEKEVRRSEEHLRLVIDTTPAMLQSALPDGYVDFFNKRWLKYVGASLDDLLGWRWTNVIHPEDVEDVVGNWRVSLATGRPFEAEARLRRADGEYRQTLFRKVPLRDEAGTVVKWYGSAIDIADRKRAEDELRKQKEVFQKIFENIPVMIVLLDQSGRHEVVNPEWERTTGWTLKEIREQNPDIFAEAFPDPQYRQIIKDNVTASTGDWADIKVRVRDGRVIDVAATFVHISGGSTLFIGKDISEWTRTQAALQEAQEKLSQVTRIQALGELTAAIAHEVNQPLTAIVTNGNFALRQLARSSPNLNDLQEALKEIVQDGTRASAIISRIRALLKRDTSDRVELDVNELIREVANLVRNEAIRSRVSVQLDLATGLPSIRGDRVQLRQVLINLVTNAIDAMRGLADRPRQLIIRSARGADGVLIEVQDSGAGIEPEQSHRIFEPFFTTKDTGIGLGLSISRSIIESHGGRLRAVPSSRGALFEFTLPTDGESAA